MPAKKIEHCSLLSPTSLQDARVALLEDTSTDENDFGALDTISRRSSSSCSLADTTERAKVKYKADGSVHRQRHQIHRGARRLGRLMVCVLLIPVLLVVFYLNIYNSVRMRKLPLAEWGYNTSRNVADYVQPESATTLLEPRRLCRDKIFLLIVVCSGVENFVARQNIRDTWGNTSEFNYAMFSQIHAHFKERYLEPSPERVQYYSEYLKGGSNYINGRQKYFNGTLSSSASSIPVRVVFLVGRRRDESMLGNETLLRLHRETEQYNDIIKEDFVDTYQNLTIKSVMMLKWVLRRCLHSTAFVMKCDDDTFVNVPNLLHYLLGGTVPLYNDTLEMHDQRSYQVMSNFNRLNATRDLLMGHLFCGVHPIADATNKWYMPAYMFPGDNYPSYLSGASYLMSSDVVPRLYAAALNTSLLYLEDIYITGICAERSKLQRRHNPLFSFKRLKSPCSFKGCITQHYLKNDDMFEFYAFVTNVSIKCALPSKYFRTMRLRKSSVCT